MANERDAVGEKVSEGIGIVSPLSDSRKVLGLDDAYFRLRQRRMHHSVGEDSPCRIENFSARANSEHRPVRAWCNYDLASQLRHRTTQRVLWVLPCASLRNIEEDRLDARVGVGDLASTAEQIEVRCDDIIRAVLAQDHVHAGYIETGGRRSDRECNGKEH